MIIALIASAMAILFVLHAETDESSAQVIESGYCGPEAVYCIYSDGTLEINGEGGMYHYGAVRAPWYQYRDEITKIVIGENITQLGAWAFVSCKHVTELTMPITLNSVVSDMYAAFAGCYRIEKINFTCGNGGHGYDYAAYEGSDSWYQNTPWYQSRDALKEINFADGITVIGSDSFRELNITSIALPESVVGLGNHCFFNCTKLTDLTLPISLNSYGNEKYPAFEGSTAVQKVTFTYGNGVPFDYNHWWYGPYKTELAPWNMNSEVPKTIIISDNITRLGFNMFYDCNIKELSIPVTTQLRDAFRSPYTNLEKLTITKGTDGYGSDFKDDRSLRCPWNSSENLKTVKVEEGVTRIGKEMFYFCDMETLILPNSLVSVGAGAFCHCSMKNLTIPISLNAVWLNGEEAAFWHVSGIRYVNLIPAPGTDSIIPPTAEATAGTSKRPGSNAGIPSGDQLRRRNNAYRFGLFPRIVPHDHCDPGHCGIPGYPCILQMDILDVPHHPDHSRQCRFERVSCIRWKRLPDAPDIHCRNRRNRMRLR